MSPWRKRPAASPRTSSISPARCARPAFRSGPARCSMRWRRSKRPASAREDDFYWTLHAVFVKRHEHSLLFDQAFRIFFRKRGYSRQADGGDAAAGAAARRPSSRRRAPSACRRRCSPTSAKASASRPRLEVDARLTVSDREVLQKKDFAQMTAAEIAAAKDAIKRLVLSLDEVKTRRLAPNRHGHRIDMRRTLRASLKAGGAIIDLKYLGPRTKPPPIVALLDISGSMSQYTRLFLHFLHAVTDARKRVHTFLFGTRLTNVTRALKAQDPDEALAACRASVPTGRAAPASRPRCRPSTSCGRAACSPRARSCC